MSVERRRLALNTTTNKRVGVGMAIIGLHPHRVPATFDSPGAGGTKLIRAQSHRQPMLPQPPQHSECSINPGAQRAPAQAFKEEDWWEAQTRGISQCWKGEPRSLKTSSWSQDESEDPHTEPRQASTLEPGGWWPQAIKR